MDRPYTAIAEMLNCEPSEVAVVQSATAAWTQVLLLTYPPVPGLLARDGSGAVCRRPQHLNDVRHCRSSMAFSSGQEIAS